MKRLWNTLRYTYRGMRGQILGWGIGLAVYGLFIVSMYAVMANQQERFQQLISSYPPEFLAFFGGSPESLLTPASFLRMYAFSMLPVIFGIFGIIAGSGLIAGDEEHGRLDLIMAHPVGRSPFFFGRSLALLGAILSIMLLGWLGFSVLLGRSDLGFSWGQMAVPFLTLSIQVLLYASLALLLSMLLPARSLAAMISGAVMVVSYFLSSLAFIDERLETVARVLPYQYYQVVMSFQELNLAWIMALLGVCLAMFLLAWGLFLRRDIRLSGEGSWRLPFMSKKAKALPAS